MTDGAYRVRCEAWVDPCDVFLSLFSEETEVVWLDSVLPYRGKKGVSYLGIPSQTIRASHAAEWERMRQAIRATMTKPDALPDGTRTPLPAFDMGWVGWVGYEFPCSATTKNRESEPAAPHAVFSRVTRMIVFDHDCPYVEVVARDTVSGRQWVHETLSRLADVATREEASAGNDVFPRCGEDGRGRDSTWPRIQWRHNDTSYRALIERCQESIAAGDAYQLCLTNTATVGDHIDPIASYRALRTINPSHHGGFLRLDGTHLLSASPEQFVSLTSSGTVVTRPIKGTRPRGRTRDEDDRLRNELVSSEKERAENLMIVDLMRNDFARVAQLGSVVVDELCVVETYPHVHQLVSTIRGKLEQQCDVWDVIDACFPAGSMTGAPKDSARAILRSLENGPRGLYSGICGYIGFDGSADFAMTIRSVVIESQGIASIGSGGGVTALSLPDDEVSEMKLKAAALIASLRPVEGYRSPR